MRIQNEDNKRLRELNENLNAEIAILKLIITKHLKKCPIGDDLSEYFSLSHFIPHIKGKTGCVKILCSPLFDFLRQLYLTKQRKII